MVTLVAVLALSAGIVGVLGNRSEGPPHRVPGDAGVWVVNQDLSQIGRFNAAIDEFDTVLPAQLRRASIIQSGASVLELDTSSRILMAIDPAVSRISGTAEVPRDSRVAIVGTDAAILSGTGQYWTVPIDDLGSFDMNSPPETVLGARAQISSTPAGGLVAVSPEAAEVRVAEPGQSLADAVRSPLRVDPDASVQLVSTAMSWAVLAQNSTMLHTAEGDVDLAGTHLGDLTTAALQMTADVPRAAPTPTTDPGAIYVATSSALVEVDLQDRTVRIRTDGHSGTPARPVVVDGCVYAAWSDGSTWRSCEGGSPTVVTASARAERTGRLAGIPDGMRPVFQVNADRVVLNDPASGVVWAVQSDNEAVSGWTEPDEPTGLTASSGEAPTPEVTTPPPGARTTSPGPSAHTPPSTQEDVPEASPSPAAPSPPLPSPVSAEFDPGTRTVALNWAPFEGAAGYFLENLGPGGTTATVPCGVGSAGPRAPTGGIVIPLGSVTSTVVPGLTPAEMSYGFLIWGYNAVACVPSALVTVDVPVTASPLSITSVQGGMIDSGDDWEFQITGIAPEADHYELQRIENGDPVGGVARVLDDGVIPRTVTGGPFGVTYEYRIRACSNGPGDDGTGCGPWSTQAAPEPSLTLTLDALRYDASLGAWSFGVLPDNGPLRVRLVCGSDSGASGGFTVTDLGCSTDVPVGTDDAYMKVSVNGHSRTFRP